MDEIGEETPGLGLVWGIDRVSREIAVAGLVRSKAAA
jgi:hypothetical protein